MKTELYEKNRTKRLLLQTIIKRGLPRNPNEKQIYQYMGFIKEEEIRGVLDRYLDDDSILREDREILREFARDVDIVVLEDGYYSNFSWGYQYELNIPFTSEEEALITRLAAEQIRLDQMKNMAYHKENRKVQIYS